MALNSFQLSQLAADDDPASPKPKKPAIALTPATEPDMGSLAGPAPDMWKRAQMLSGLKQELDAWHARGGKIRSGDNATKDAGEIQMPGGVYGGEFSDEEMNAYQDAAAKYSALLAEHMAELKTNRSMKAANEHVSAPADATSVLVRALTQRKGAK